MDPTNCRLCGASRAAHIRVILAQDFTTSGFRSMEVCPTALYTPVATHAPVLELDAMPVQGPPPGSPAAEGKVWDPAAREGRGGWVKRASLAVLACLLALPVSAQTVDLRTYWPQPATGLQLTSQEYATSPSFRSTLRRYVKRGQVRGVDVYRMEEFSPTYLDAWQYRDDGTQILEVATELLGSHLVYEVGKEIQWGGTMTVGDVVTRTVHVDVAASTGTTTGYWNWGTQKITFTSYHSSYTTATGLTFSGVVKLSVFQSWCANSGCAYPSGQNIWTFTLYLAPGAGIVEIDYLTPNARTDGATVMAETWETP